MICFFPLQLSGSNGKEYHFKHKVLHHARTRRSITHTRVLKREPMVSLYIECLLIIIMKMYDDDDVVVTASHFVVFYLLQFLYPTSYRWSRLLMTKLIVQSTDLICTENYAWFVALCVWTAPIRYATYWNGGFFSRQPSCTLVFSTHIFI